MRGQHRGDRRWGRRQEESQDGNKLVFKKECRSRTLLRLEVGYRDAAQSNLRYVNETAMKIIYQEIQRRMGYLTFSS